MFKDQRVVLDWDSSGSKARIKVRGSRTTPGCTCPPLTPEGVGVGGLVQGAVPIPKDLG